VDIEQCRSGQGFQNYQKSSFTGTSTMDGPCALSATSLQKMCQTSFYASADDRAAAASLWKMMGVNTCNDGLLKPLR
jgi:hypothetical protein